MARKEKRIALIGVGGAGMNAVERITPYSTNISITVAVNRDLSSLRKTTIKNTVGLHLEKWDKNSIQESVISHMAEFRSLLEDIDHSIIFSGLGGYTGSYATPEIVRLLKNFGQTVWVVAYQPFLFEGNSRLDFAIKSMKEMKDSSDLFIALQNQWLINQAKYEGNIFDGFNYLDLTVGKTLGLFSRELSTPEEIIKALPKGATAYYN